MRESEFINWMIAYTGPNGEKLSKKTRRDHITGLRRIERDEPIVADKQFLDEQFKLKQLPALMASYYYTIEDERNNKPNPTRLKTRATQLSNTLLTIRSQLKKYHEFCKVHPPK